MRLHFFANILFSVALWISASYFTVWHKELYEEFSRVGWRAYSGWDLDAPYNFFSYLIIFLGGYALYICIQTSTQLGWKRFSWILGSIAISLIILGLGLRLADGGFSIRKSAWMWQTLLICNIILSVMSFLKFEIKNKKSIPQAFHDILDDPNSITHQEESKNEE